MELRQGWIETVGDGEKGGAGVAGSTDPDAAPFLTARVLVRLTQQITPLLRLAPIVMPGLDDPGIQCPDAPCEMDRRIKSGDDTMERGQP